MFQKPLLKFTTKAEKEIEIWEPSMERLPDLLRYVNRLVDEDTYLTFTAGNRLTLEQEKVWLEQKIKAANRGKDFLVWAVCDGKIVGSCDFTRSGSLRDQHVGTVGLMVDRDFRQDGIGQFLLEFIMEKARKLPIKIIKLTVFSDNDIALKLYDKLGFVKYGRLPNGLYRQDKYSDAVKMYKKL